MALFRKLFYRKPPDRLLEIAERVYGMLPFRIPCCSCAVSEEMYVVSVTYCLLGE